MPNKPITKEQYIAGPFVTYSDAQDELVKIREATTDGVMIHCERYTNSWYVARVLEVTPETPMPAVLANWDHAAALRIEDAEEYLKAVWGRPAFVNSYHVGGQSLPSYSATDHNGHYLPMERDWDWYGCMVVRPMSGEWPVRS